MDLYSKKKTVLSKNNILDNTNEELISKYDYCLVYFDLETSGFSSKCDILQVAMSCNGVKFDSYINPSQPIDPRASDTHGITTDGCNLYLHGNKIQSHQKKTVAQNILKYLNSFDKKCVLIAHNCNFDAPRLVYFYKKLLMIDQLKCVVAGFTDTLPLFRAKYPERKGKDAHSLVGLAEAILQISTSINAHDAKNDVYILECLIKKTEISDDAIVKNFMKFYDIEEKLIQSENKDKNLFSLICLGDVVTLEMLKRMAGAGITLDMLTDTYCNMGEKKTIELLKQCKNGRPQVIKTKSIMDNILNYLKNDLKLTPKNE